MSNKNLVLQETKVMTNGGTGKGELGLVFLVFFSSPPLVRFFFSDGRYETAEIYRNRHGGQLAANINKHCSGCRRSLIDDIVDT